MMPVDIAPRKISVIVPVYNVEQYIEQCLCSLEDQGLAHEEYEIIVIDDCSPDGSMRIVERLVKQFSNIIVLRNEVNLGLGLTRNRGIECAKGEYVVFADSDDWYEKGALAAIYDSMSSNKLDILHYGYYDYIDSTGETQVKNMAYPASKLMKGAELLVMGRYYSYLWSYAFSRCFLLEHGFKMRPCHFEDTDFTIKNLIFASRVMYLDRPLYYYRHRLGSIIFNDNPMRNLPIIDSYREALNFVRSSTDVPNRAEVLKRVRDVAGYDLLGIMKGDIIDRYGTWREYVKAMREMDLIPVNNDKRSLQRMVFNFSPRLYVLLVQLFFRRSQVQY